MADNRYMMHYETVIYQLLQKLLGNSRPYDLESVLPMLSDRLAKKSINLNDDGIRRVLKSLVEKGKIVQGSTMTRNEILMNENRNRIYEFIKMNPGAYFYRIVRELQLSNHIVTWHLNMLIKFTFVQFEYIGRNKVYFVEGAYFREAEFGYYVNHQKCRKIIQCLLANPDGLNKTSIADEIDVHYNTVTKYLKKLKKIRIVSEEIGRGQQLYKVPEEQTSLLLQNL